MPHYSSKGLELYFEQQGDGTPLILLHGFGQHGGSWAPLVPAYARNFSVVVPDMRGCGRSQIVEPGFSSVDLADDVVALMDHIGAERAHVAGWSLGGTVAIELALGHADRLVSLSLHSSFAGGRDRYQANWVDMRKRIIASGDRELDFSTAIIGFFTPEFINSRPDRIEEFQEMLLSNPYPPTADGMAGQTGAARQFEARDRIASIRTPTLITVGSADRTTLPAQSRLMHETIEGAEFILFDGVGHMSHFQVRDEFISVSQGFMLKHER
jgi:pimeloyl-ACP methyl ester carboxylesterase